MTKPIVRSTLESKVESWANSQSPVLPIAFENDDFVKPTSGEWLECFLMPNRIFSRETTAQHNTEIGLFQINVWTRKGQGLGTAEQIAEDLAAQFPVVPKGAVSIEQPPLIGRPLQDDSGWAILPVLISYRYEG